MGYTILRSFAPNTPLLVGSHEVPRLTTGAKLTQREENIATLQTAWSLYLPTALPLDERYAGIWAHHAGDTDLALLAIEETAERHKRQPLREPAQYCWSRLRSKINAHFAAQESSPTI